ncbi:MAG TPA: aldehyde dehydrogenase family protein [Blastocatellia bacterium]|nr:aldehyde dehydrogenase family protein [Blastocatellia bacterium]HMX27178.1 aldehyde dehydrogenase family protein [Blastocatellia bacterium]HMY74372.1 aldehyde dehydrogenase family protein [Blastocatellia bacterium]HNG34020.1 aldehyde dehydrogenase family protein [Blastocatellia bacterium]
MTKEIQKTISPIDGSIYAERHLATPQQIEIALAKAVAAQAAWRQTPVSERADICRKMKDWLVENADEIGKELTWQIGRPIAYSPFELRRGFNERVNFMCDIAERELADIAVEPKDNFQRFIRREPVGTVLVLAPWNYPWLASVNAVVPAILAGNSVILKIAPQTPLVAERYFEAFAAAGLPAGVFQFLHIDHDQVAEVIKDSRINFVAFTGSVGGGHAVQRAAAERFIATGLELGGKDPAYVRADANLEAAIENLVDGAMFNSGQSCCAVERIYVHQDVYDRFIASAIELTKQYRLGNPLEEGITLGPMVRTDAADKARAHIAEALQKGATALIDESLFPMSKAGTPYLAPQILTNVDHSMLVMTEETFAPVVGVMPVKNDEEAVRLMNDSKYGLTASLWTSDVDAALSIGDQIETGTFYMNRCDYLDPALAWTGVKDSGRGCTLSRLGFEAFTRPKSFHLRLKL